MLAMSGACESCNTGLLHNRFIWGLQQLRRLSLVTALCLSESGMQMLVMRHFPCASILAACRGISESSTLLQEHAFGRKLVDFVENGVLHRQSGSFRRFVPSVTSYPVMAQARAISDWHHPTVVTTYEVFFRDNNFPVESMLCAHLST